MCFLITLSYVVCVLYLKLFFIKSCYSLTRLVWLKGIWELVTVQDIIQLSFFGGLLKLNT